MGISYRMSRLRAAATLVCAVVSSGFTAAQPLPVLDVVVGNNFGHLPMFIGAEKGIFKAHGVDVRLKVVNTGTDIVKAMQKREDQLGDILSSPSLMLLHTLDPLPLLHTLHQHP